MDEGVTTFPACHQKSRSVLWMLAVEEGVHSYSSMSLQELSGNAVHIHGRWVCSISGMTPQGLSSPVENSHGIGKHSFLGLALHSLFGLVEPSHERGELSIPDPNSQSLL